MFLQRDEMQERLFRVCRLFSTVSKILRNKELEAGLPLAGYSRRARTGSMRTALEAGKKLAASATSVTNIPRSSII